MSFVCRHPAPPPKHWTAILKRIKWAVGCAGYEWPRRVSWRFYHSLWEVDRDGKRGRLHAFAETEDGESYVVNMVRDRYFSETAIHEVAHIVSSFGHNKTWGACYGALYGAYYDSSAGPEVPR